MAEETFYLFDKPSADRASYALRKAEELHRVIPIDKQHDDFVVPMQIAHTNIQVRITQSKVTSGTLKDLYQAEQVFRDPRYIPGGSYDQYYTMQDGLCYVEDVNRGSLVVGQVYKGDAVGFVEGTGFPLVQVHEIGNTGTESTGCTKIVLLNEEKDCLKIWMKEATGKCSGTTLGNPDVAFGYLVGYYREELEAWSTPFEIEDAIASFEIAGAQWYPTYYNHSCANPGGKLTLTGGTGSVAGTVCGVRVGCGGFGSSSYADFAFSAKDLGCEGDNPSACSSSHIIVRIQCTGCTQTCVACEDVGGLPYAMVFTFGGAVVSAGACAGCVNGASYTLIRYVDNTWTTLGVGGGPLYWDVICSVPGCGTTKVRIQLTCTAPNVISIMVELFPGGATYTANATITGDNTCEPVLVTFNSYESPTGHVDGVLGVLTA